MSEISEQEIQAVADEIADTLGEKQFKPRRQVYLITKYCGIDFALDLLREAQEIEANGGQIITTGERRRTIGGIFFNRARERVEPEQTRQLIFFAWRTETQERIQRELDYANFDYTERGQLIPQLRKNTGKVGEVRIILVGRPQEIEHRKNLVILMMQDQINESAALPTGVPRPDPSPVEYAIYASSKQWDRVEEALNDPQDEVIIEGFCGYDAETQAMAVFATYVTTRRLQRKDRKAAKHQRKLEEQQLAKAQKQGVKGKAKKDNNFDQASIGKEALPKVPEPESQIELPPGMPDEQAQKLIELHKAAATFREKIANLESKPEDQRFGLEMTHKLLKNTEGQIEKLEQQYAANRSS